MDLAIIEELETPALQKLAGYYENTARQVRLVMAERQRQARIRASSEQALNEIHQATLLAATMMNNGVPYERAMMEAANTSSISQATLEAHHKQLIKREKENARRILEIQIMRLARAGLSNIQIADKLGIGRNRVGRIITAALHGA